MNKETFLRDLRTALTGMAPDEIENAIEYYEEYFAEAGPEREMEILKELGSAQAVAAQIRVDISLRRMEGPNPPSAKKGISAVWLIILAIFAAPVALPLAIALTVTALAMVISVGAVVFAILIAAGALLFSGVLLGILSVQVFVLSIPGGLICFGTGIALAGASMLMIVLMIFCSRMGFRGIAYLMNRMSKKKRGQVA